MHDFILETQRLLLRPLRVSDAAAVFQWAGDPLVARYMVYNTYASVEEVESWLRSVQAQEDAYEFGFVRKQDSLLIGSGSIGPDAARAGFWGFGYNLRRDCWGAGYATEAAKAMLRFAQETFGVTRFSSSHVEANRASGRVMEKCGLHFVKYGQFEKLDGSGKARSMEYESIILCPETACRIAGDLL